METNETLKILEPIVDIMAVEECWLSGRQGLVRGKRPIPEIVDEAMFLRILMDVSRQVQAVSLFGDKDAFEGSFKKGTCSFIRFVEGFCVCIKETRESKMWFFPIQT